MSLIEQAPSSLSKGIAKRAALTLRIMHRWGYAPTLENLAVDLLGGAVAPSHLAVALVTDGEISTRDGFIYLPGHETLVPKSRERVSSHRVLNGKAVQIAERFARDLVEVCPVVECVSLSGSVASGGYASGDDIDLDIFAQDGTKYLVYGICLLLGLQASLRHWRSHGFRKLICINVVWTQSQTRPFFRKDEDMAFELLHCRPITGGRYFADTIRANEWALSYFPQVEHGIIAEEDQPEPRLLGRLVMWIARHRRVLAVADQVSRAATRCVYELAHWLRSRDPKAMERLEFLQRAKYPYEVFQD